MIDTGKAIRAKYARIHANLMLTEARELYNAGHELTLQQAALLTGLSVKTYRNLVSSGQLDAVLIDGKPHIEATELRKRKRVLNYATAIE